MKLSQLLQDLQIAKRKLGELDPEVVIEQSIGGYDKVWPTLIIDGEIVLSLKP